MLITAAAQKWGVSVGACKAQSGYIIHQKSSRKLGYGELVEAAGKLDVPSDPTLKAP